MLVYHISDNGKQETIKEVNFEGISETESKWPLVENGEEKELSEDEALSIVYGIGDRAPGFSFVPFAKYTK